MSESEILLQKQQEAERKRQEYVSLKEKEAELQRISDEKRKLELEERRKQLHEKREKNILAANLARDDVQQVQERILQEKKRLDSLQCNKRDAAHKKLEDEAILKYSTRDNLSQSVDYFMRSIRRVFVLLDVNGDGIVSKVNLHILTLRW